MTEGTGLEACLAMAGCGRVRLQRACRRGAGVCLLMIAASFTFFLVSSSHRARLSFLIHSQPGYNDFLMFFNTSVPLSHSSSQVSPATPHHHRGVPKGFLVHSPSCSIPDFDPMHYTIKRFISKPKPIICGKPPAFTSANGTSLFFHWDILRLHFSVLQQIYDEMSLAEKQKAITTAKTKSKTTTKPRTTVTMKSTTPSSKSSTTTTTTTTTTSTTNTATSPPTTPSSKSGKISTSPPPSSSRPSKRTKRSVKAKVSPEDVKCCYKGIARVQQKRKDANGKADFVYKYNDTCKPLNDTKTEVADDAALVECRIGSFIVYQNVHYFFHRKRFLSSPVIISLVSNAQRVAHSGMLGAQRSSSSKLTQGNIQSINTPAQKAATKVNPSAGNPSTHKTTSTQTPTTTKSPTKMQRVKDSEKLNVIIMGTDSVSRLNLIRQMPKTYNYLTKELGALDLKGYNKVADNTFPNLMAILGGMTLKEVEEAPCVTKSKHYDDCHWVWKDFKKSDYVTAYMEDSPWTGTFHYLRRGFIEKPTDFYGRTFMIASEDRIGCPKKSRSHYCQGNVLSIKVVQDYALEFARTFLDTPSFGYFWSSSLTHDYLNMAQLADDHYHQHLQQMEKIGALNNTAFFFLSDHGMRFGGIRSTYLGMLEERLPYVVLYLPPWFRKKYHHAFDNLVSNTHRLTSNFDVHETLLDFAYGRFADPAYVTSEPSRTKRGTSLFRDIPWNRTCAEANIPTHYCTCQDTHELTEEDPYLVPAAERFLDIINDQLLPYSQCEQFTKIKVLSAHASIRNQELKPKEEKSDLKTYLLQAAFSPGNVVLEASLSHTSQENSFQLLGAVSRINKYGSTSACIQHDILRKYCYCKDQERARELYKEQQLGNEVRKSTRSPA